MDLNGWTIWPRLGLGRLLKVLVVVVLGAGLGSCRPAIPADSPLPERVLLVGSGASFPALIYQSWFIRLN